MKKKLLRMTALILVFCLFSGGITLQAEDVTAAQDEVQTGDTDEPVEYSKIDNEGSGEEGKQEDLQGEEDNSLNDSSNSSLPPQNIDGNLDKQQPLNEQDADITATVEVSNEDRERGTFSVRAYGFSDINVIRDVRFAVWSEQGGQDDLVWKVVEDEENGEYCTGVSISDHNYSLGKYIVDVYAVLESGEQIGLGSAEYVINVENSELKISKTENAGAYSFVLEDVMVPGGEDAIMFAVWSENNGQDDLTWYDAVKQTDGSYRYNWSVQNHRALGKYNVHVYARTKGNSMQGMGSYEFTIDPPQIGSVEIENLNEAEGTFAIKIKDVASPELIKEILVPVWSEKNGQDDLVWYGAQKKSDETYELNINIKNHRYMGGLYNVHVYIIDITGYQYFAGSTECNLEEQKGNLQIEKVNDKKYRIVLKDLMIPGGVSEVLFPVWSENNGQDDLIWYTAAKNSEGNFAYTLDLSHHRGLGKYNVHAYAKKKNGDQLALVSVDFTTETPYINNFEIESVDKTAGRFTVKVSDIENADLIKNIKIPVWSKTDQSDLVWYNARKTLKGEYVVEVDIRDHRYNIGRYNVHCYVEDITGGLSGVGTTVCDMSAEMKNLRAEDKDGTESIFTVSIEGLRVPVREKELRIAVWGDKNGQNDLAWHTLNYRSDGNYSLDVKIRNHGETGLYNVHIYCVTRSGEMVGLGRTSFEVSSVPVYANVVTSEMDGTKGTFRVTISGLMAPSGIEKVEMPMWCSEDQSDVAWYEASKLGEGVYTTIMNVKNHRYHFGDYKIHVYVTMGNGVRVGVSSSTMQNISPSNYLYNEYVSDTQRRVWLLGVDGELVQFPTWSDENGQDDIVWYRGTNHGNGTWSTVVDSVYHSNGGNYTTHAYVTKNGVIQSVGATGYSLTKIPTDQEMMRLKANSYSSTTGYIALVNRTTHKVGIFQGWQGNWRCIQYWDCSDGKASTPTVEGVFRVGSRGHHFYSGDAICYWWTQFYGDYLFHSVLYNRYNGSLMDGRLGMGLSHGCVRLDINNAKWIYDTIPSGTTVVVYH